MIERLIEILDLGKYKNIRKIPKNTFYKSEDFNRTYEKLFTSDIESIYIISALNKNVINISDYKTDEYNYSEIYYIYVSLKSDKKILDINKIIHSIIPNPCIIIYGYNSNITITSAKKRINKTDATKQVIDRYFISDKIDLDYLTEADKGFLDDIELTKNSFENFLRFYMDISNKILILSLQNIRGGYKNTSLENIGVLITKIDNIKLLERDKDLLDKKYKEEIGMGQKAKLHSQIVKKDEEISSLKEEIKNI